MRNLFGALYARIMLPLSCYRLIIRTLRTEGFQES